MEHEAPNVSKIKAASAPIQTLQSPHSTANTHKNGGTEATNKINCGTYAKNHSGNVWGNSWVLTFGVNSWVLTFGVNNEKLFVGVKAMKVLEKSDVAPLITAQSTAMNEEWQKASNKIHLMYCGTALDSPPAFRPPCPQ